MIGYYVHHRGAGHLSRVRAIAAQTSAPLTALSSLPRPSGWDHGWVDLPLDEEQDAIDPTGRGALHWAPIHTDGLRARMEAIAAWIARARPAVLVADVSVEVAVYARLMGIPVVVMGMPGDRTDAPHQLAYRMAERIICPWPAWAHPARGLEPWEDKVRNVGAISRFDGCPRPAPHRGRTRVAVRQPPRPRCSAPRDRPRRPHLR